MHVTSRITTLALSLLVVASPLAAQTTIIRARTVIDGKGGTLNNVAIVIEGSKMVRIEPAATDATYDLTAQTVMPGMIDTHTHIVDHFNRSNGRLHTANDPETLEQTTLYAYENAYKTLMAGFTTLQSPGNPVDKDIRDWINDGRVPGPRILTSIHQIFANSGTPQQIRALVDKWIKEEGADFVKIFASGSIREGGLKTMSDEQIQAACDEAQQTHHRPRAGAGQREVGDPRRVPDDRARQSTERRRHRADGAAWNLVRFEQPSDDSQLPGEQGALHRHRQLHRGRLSLHEIGRAHV